MKSVNITDDPSQIIKYKKYFFKRPFLMNIRTTRLFWHAGAGEDDYKRFDRYLSFRKKLGHRGERIDKENKKYMKSLWEKQLKKQ